MADQDAPKAPGSDVDADPDTERPTNPPAGQ